MQYTIKSRIWIESEGHVFLGEGRIQLLKAIAETGSLSKAAKSLNLSYKKAWHLIDSVNKTSKQPVTINSTGGKGGGGAELTDYGKKLIVLFDDINKNCWNFLDEQLKKLETI
ncbi:winged helix-turn-helix domain-containing protein [Snuella sedimenti]|uniref:LysR family transcriptional regulator n=1 Tax=Snuella sedimenti TaxID=2798802 RepID=A0A8J7ISS9_9FLAO|nr:LysR family transcriptional regulator [Snuella sedimenti]MBJ6367265.1 LysR family transcriptional regulator [Snuella sedimenti]